MWHRKIALQLKLSQKLNNRNLLPSLVVTAVAKDSKMKAGLHGLELCERCGEVMVETHCKVVCIKCGYMRDCNDQW